MLEALRSKILKETKNWQEKYRNTENNNTSRFQVNYINLL